jgi:hypothetical protein
MTTVNRVLGIHPTAAMLSRDEVLGGVLGGLTGGVIAGLLLQVGAVDGLRAQATMYGFEASTAPGWGVHLAHSALLGFVYAGVMNVATDWYLTRVLSVTRRSETAASVVRPLMGRLGIAVVVAGATGLQFGLVVWLVLSVVLVPLAAGDAGGTVPQVRAVALVAFVGYGLVLGGVYGKLVEQ